MNKIFAILLSFQFMIAPVAMAGNCSSETDKYCITGDGGSSGNDKYLNLVMMTASAAIGSNFISCQGGQSNNIPTFSHYIFLVGAVVLLMAEIAAAIKQKEAKEESEKQMARQGLAESKPGDYVTQEQKDAQLTLLNTAKAEEEKNRDALEARMDWMTAAEAVYWLAVAGAAVETILYALTQIPAYGQAIGYRDWSLTCNNDSLSDATLMMIGAAYGAIPGLVGGDIGGALTGGLSVAGFMMILKMITKSVGTSIKAAINTAPGRIVIFGVFAALATTARNGLKESRDRANDNIALIDKTINDWKAASTVTTEIDTGDDGPEMGDSSIKPLPSVAPIKPLAAANVPPSRSPRSCLSGNASGLQHSASSCSRPLKIDRSGVNFNNKYLNGVANQSLDLADAMARDDMASARVLAGSLGANAAKVKAEALNMIKDANEKQKLAGLAPLDFEKEVNSQLANFSKMAQDAAKDSGLKGLSGSAPTLASSGSEKKDDKSGVTSVKSPVTLNPVMPNLNLGSQDQPADTTAVKEATLEQRLNDFEPSQSEISKRSDVSIFQMLSHRYGLSYDKILTRRKVAKPIKDVKK
jgi:hypothetical protein